MNVRDAVTDIGALWWRSQRVLRDLQRRLPWPVLLALLALPVALLLALRAWQDGVAAASAAEQLALLPTRDAIRDRRTVGGDRERLAAFYASLPTAESIPQVVASLMSGAAAEGLVLQAGEYRAEPDVAGAYQHYRMTLPVQGDAAALQTFLLKALRAQRTLALESVTLKRERIESRQVEANIRLVLFTRPPAGGAAP